MFQINGNLDLKIVIFTINHTWLDQPPPLQAGHRMGSDQFGQRHKRPERLWKTISKKMKYKYERCENWENRDWSWRLDDKLSSCRSMYQFWVEIMMRMAIEWYIVQLDSLVVGSNRKWRVWCAVDDSLWHLQEIMNIFSFVCLFHPCSCAIRQFLIVLMMILLRWLKYLIVWFEYLISIAERHEDK